MILGVGIDLCRTSRIERALSSGNFMERVFTPDEIAYAESKKNKKSAAESYASAFAAREAFCKASGLSLWLVALSGNFSLLRGRDGKPEIRISSKLAEKFEVPVKISVSITHDGEYAAAVVVIEKVDS